MPGPPATGLGALSPVELALCSSKSLTDWPLLSTHCGAIPELGAGGAAGGARLVRAASLVCGRALGTARAAARGAGAGTRWGCVCGEGRGVPRTCLQPPGSPGAAPPAGSPGRTQDRLQLFRPAGCSSRSVVQRLGRRLCSLPCVFSAGRNTVWPCEVLKGTERIKGTGGRHEQATMCGRSQHAGFLQMPDWHRVSGAHLLSCS